MRYFFDTSILLPAALTAHSNHVRATLLIHEVSLEAGSNDLLCLSTHVIVEMYATYPHVARQLDILVAPYQIVEAIKAIALHLTTVNLVEADYFSALERCASLELTGAVVYDALHYQAALKSNADFLYTENRRDFDRLQKGSDGLTIRSLPE